MKRLVILALVLAACEPEGVSWTPPADLEGELSRSHGRQGEPVAVPAPGACLGPGTAWQGTCDELCAASDASACVGVLVDYGACPMAWDPTRDACDRPREADEHVRCSCEVVR